MGVDEVLSRRIDKSIRYRASRKNLSATMRSREASMRNIRGGISLAGLILVVALGTTGCTQVLTETAKKALEDRSTEDQVTEAGPGVRKN
jgi:hypothetical protein